MLRTSRSVAPRRDTPGEYFSHPRWYHALVPRLLDVDMLICVHGANDPKVGCLLGLLDIGVSKRQIAVISKTDMPDTDVAATRKLLLETGFEEPIFELNSHDPQSVQQLVDYLASLTKQEEAGEKLITANDTREAHARGELAMSVVLHASIITRKLVKWLICWVLPSPDVMNRSRNGVCSRQRISR